MSALSNARWLILIQAYKIILQLLSMGILARLLPPSDYGLIAMAWTATNFATLLRDLGTTSAIIQKNELTEQIKSTIFWMQMALGLFLCIILIAFSGVIAKAFNELKLQTILSLLAITFPLGGISAVHQAMLERESSFRVLARIEIVASSSGLFVAIISAYLGAGVYSFVWQSFVITLLYVIQSTLAYTWRPLMVWDRQAIRQIFGYSSNLSAYNFISFFTRNADSLIIGRYLGATALGTYSMAYKLMLFPLQNLTTVANRALFPVMSRQQDSNSELASLYVRVVAMVAAISTPMMAGLFILREPFTKMVFGGQWGDVAHIIVWLAPVGALQSIVNTTVTVYTAKGRTDILFRTGLLSAIITVCAFFGGLSRGVVGVALFYCFANMLIFVPQTYFACRLISLPYRTFLRGLAPPLICTAIMSPVVFYGYQNLLFLGDIPASVISTGIGALSYFICYLVFFREGMLKLLQVVLGNKLSRLHRANRIAPGSPKI